MATAEEYRDQLRALLPTGAAWPTEADSILARLLYSWADELARTHGRGLDLVEEADPRTTSELIAEWERVTGLPDACHGLGATLQARRAEVVQRITSRGGQSRQFFIDVAGALGFAITITEYDAFTVGQVVGLALQGEEWRHLWRVNAPAVTVVDFSAGQSTAGEPLRSWGNTVLECVIRRLKPAHTHVIFAYA